MQEKTITSGMSKPTKQLSKKEMDECRRKALCYWCPEKYSIGHRFKESHVYTLIVDGEEEEFVDAMGDEQVAVDGIINAIEGKRGISTLQLKGYIKNKPVDILIDTGSTYNVINSSVAKHLGLKIQVRSPLRLSVADCRQVEVDKQCLDLGWRLGKHEFVADFLVMKI